MNRYVALLRGVSPSNAKMADLKRCFEIAGFTDVKTVLSSGNVMFDGQATSEAQLEERVEAAMHAQLGRSFITIVRPVAMLRDLLANDPYAAFRVPANAKRVVSFLREPATPKIALPLHSDGAQVLCMVGREAFTAYVPSPNGPISMTLIEKAFGTQITTRTWETVRKCTNA